MIAGNRDATNREYCKDSVDTDKFILVMIARIRSKKCRHSCRPVKSKMTQTLPIRILFEAIGVSLRIIGGVLIYVMNSISFGNMWGTSLPID